MELYAWGKNNFGQLGLGSKSYFESTPQRVPIEDQTYVESIQQVAGGGLFTLALSTDGVLYSTGCNERLQLGYTGDSDRFKPIEALQIESIKSVSCGWDFAAAITDNKNCYVWGSNEFQQIGLPKNLKMSKPRRLNVSNVRDVSCGYRHMLILLENGEVLACGDNKYFQLGFGSNKGTFTLTRVPGLTNIQRICCGFQHSFASRYDGSIMGWGSNKFGQIAMDSRKHPIVKIPRYVDLDYSLKSVDAKGNHSVMIDTNQLVYTFGENSRYQLGMKRADTWQPERLLTTHVLSASTGYDFSGAITSENKLITWGNNDLGQCGRVSNDIPLLPPGEVDLPQPVRYFAAGAKHSFAIV